MPDALILIVDAIWFLAGLGMVACVCLWLEPQLELEPELAYLDEPYVRAAPANDNALAAPDAPTVAARGRVS